MNTWTDANKLAEVPSVHDALAAFSEDSTGDNGTAVVLAVLEAAQSRLTELELACAQAVEFATYVEEHAKGKMEDAARRFMSMEFAQELAGVLKAGREAQAKAAGIAKFQQALDEAGNKSLKVLAAEFIGNELSAAVADVHNVHHVGAIFSERRTLADFAKLLVPKESSSMPQAPEGG